MKEAYILRAEEGGVSLSVGWRCRPWWDSDVVIVDGIASLSTVGERPCPWWDSVVVVVVVGGIALR